MGVSALFLAVLLALLGLLVDFSANSISIPGHEYRLIVRVTRDSEPASELPTKQATAPAPARQVAASTVPVDPRHEVAPIPSPDVPADSPSGKDWQALGEAAARASIDDHFRSEEARASMWRQTRSVMFAPTGEFVLKEEAPAIPDFRFRPRIHVVGLGVTVGSCFIGLPIAGVPVEQRSLAINLFVCAEDSG